MKKIVALMMLSVLTFGSAKANPVSPATARQVATTWMQAMGMGNVKTLVDVTAQTPFTEFYLFAAPDSGFIIVSGDDCAVPVIGYSVENSFSTKDIPQHVLSFLTAYEEEIRWSKQHPNNIADTVARQWQMLTNGQMPKAVYDHGVLPLITTRWYQEPYYNDLCPLDSTGTHFKAGCVAVSMAQVMKYWNFPERGYGSHSYEHYFLGTISADFGSTTYDWPHMPYRLTAASSPEEVNAVATLMYNAGVSVDMTYEYGGSGTYGEMVPNALYKYFKYRGDINVLQRNDYTDSEFGDLFRNELDQHRPMILGGLAVFSGEHSFVCDGYTTRNYFHYNLGWGGVFDGYYVLSGNMAKGLRSQTCVIRIAITGIQPNADWNTVGNTTVTASVIGATATVSGTGIFPSNSFVSIRVDEVEEGYRFARWSDGSRDNPRTFFANGGNYHFTAMLEPLTGDTLSYCGNYSISSAFYLGDTARWGIYLPSLLFTQNDTLTAVQLFTLRAGNYSMSIYLDSIVEGNLLYSSTTHFDNDGWDETQWHTIPLSTPIVVDSSHGLIIAFESHDTYYSATFIDHYSGTPYASLCGDSLRYYDPNCSWMIRAIFGTSDLQPPIPDPCEGVFQLPYYIENDSASFTENASCWTKLDADGDGYNWVTNTTSFSSHSWKGGVVLTPDNWLFSPAFELPNIPCSLIWSDKFDRHYYNEHYNVYISTTGTDTADFTLLAEFTGDSSGAFTKHEIMLDDWSDNIVHLAFRHFNSTDQNYLNISSIRVVTNEDKAIDVYSNNDAWGSVTGSGSYVYGSSVTVEAIPFEGNTFQQWSNGVADNPYTLTLTSDTVLTALFLNTTGIGDADYEGITLYVRDGHIVVEGAEGEEVQLYDMEGRLLWSSIPTGELNTKHLTLNTGTYLVRVGNRPAQKIIVIQ